LNSTLLPLIEGAKSGVHHLFFLDASNFVMGGFSGRCWSVVRKWVKTACGRQRFNVLGALDFVNKRVETVVNTTYITSTQVNEMLEKLAQRYVGKPLKIILDNAKYQRCSAVTETAKRLNIELIFLPTYSPNLNLIERVWKLVKSEVLNSAYHETFECFSHKIENCIGSLHTKFATQMATLITQKFHIIDTKNIIS
jgi:transposase